MDEKQLRLAGIIAITIVCTVYVVATTIEQLTAGRMDKFIVVGPDVRVGGEPGTGDTSGGGEPEKTSTAGVVSEVGGATSV